MKETAVSYRRRRWNSPGQGGRLLLAVLLALMPLLSVVNAQAGDGGGLAPSFPLVDTQTGKQESTASAVDSNGDVVVTGYQNLSGGTNDDFYTVKFKGDGSGIVWRAFYDKSGGSDVATAVVIDQDNNVIVTGYVWNGINNDIHTIKYNGATGVVMWQQTYNGTAAGNDVGTSVTVDAAGDVYVGGYSQNAQGNDDSFILKYAASGGAAVWEERFGNPSGIDRINAVAVGPASLAATGYSWNGTKFEIVTRTYGFDRSFLREWRYATAATGSDMGKFILFAPDGNLVVSGYVSNDSDSDIYVAKYNVSTGATVWDRIFNGGFEDEPKGIAVDNAGDVYVTGYTWTLAGRYDLYTARYAGGDGSVQWEDILNTGTNNDDVTVPYGIAVDRAAGAVYVTGYTYKSAYANYDVVLVKYNVANGSRLWRTLFDGLAHRNDQPVGIGLNSSGDILIGAWSERITDADFIVLKFDRGALFGPTGLTAKAVTDTSALLAWTDNAVDETGFLVERKLGETGSWGEIATLPSNTTSWTDPNLVPNNYYFYRIRAYKDDGVRTHSLYSNEPWILSKVISYSVPSWTHVFNSAGNREDYAEAIAVGPDDNPVVTGRSDLPEVGVDPPAFSYDYYTMKLDRADVAEDRVLWDAVYDSGDGGMDVAKSLVVNGQNEVFVTGNAYVYWPGAETNTNDVFTLKYPSVGPPESWHHQYNGPSGGDDRSTSIASAVDGSNNVAVVGYGINGANNADIYVMKLSPTPTIDENGNAEALWAALPFNGGGDDYPTAVAFGPSGDVFVAGYTRAGQYYQWYVAKHDGATGQVVWSETNGTIHGDAVARSLAVDSRGNVFVTGYVTVAGGQKKMYTVKYDGAASPAMRTLWETDVEEGPAGEGVSVRIDPIDEAVVVAGTRFVSPGNDDFHVTRYTNAEGSVVWEQNFERPLNDDQVVAMAIDSSGYLYIAGNTSNGDTTDILSIIYDYNGNFLHATVYDGSGNDFDEAKDVTANFRGEGFVAGYTTNSSGNADYVVYKQKNSYILVPAPFTAVANADYTKMNLSWRGNTPTAGFHLWRTRGAISQYTEWTPLPDQPPGTTSFIDSGLEENTLYCYKIDAFAGSLSSRPITTCATTALHAPASVTATPTSTTEIALGWENVPANTGFSIDRKIGTGSWAFLATTAAGVASHTDRNLTAGTLYTYRVSSRSAAGTSVASAEVPVYTNPVPPVLNPPTLVTSDRIDLSWNNVLSNTGYEIERKVGEGAWEPRATVGKDVTIHSDTPLTDNTSYSYRISALNGSGRSVPSNVLVQMTQVLPTTLQTLNVVSASQIDLTWDPVSAATGYTVYQASCSYSDNSPPYCDLYDWAWGGWYPIATTGTGVTTVQRTGLSAGTYYRFHVVATTANNSSAPSNILKGWTHLAAPTLTVSPATETSLSLSWNNITGETNFTVERKQGEGGTWADVPAGTAIGTSVTTYTDQSLLQQTSYCYRVRAYSTVTGGPAPVLSNEACLITPLPAPTLATPVVPSTTQVDLSWNNVEGNTGYDLERCTTNYPDNPEYIVSYNNADWLWSCAVVPLLQDQNSYSDGGRTAGYTYRYRVRVKYLGGVSGWSVHQVATTIPPVPTIGYINAVSTTQIDLNWTNVYGDTSYLLEWKEGEAGTWNSITTAQNVYYYSHTGRTSGVTYYYRVRARNMSGESGISAEVSKPALLNAPVLGTPSEITINSVTLAWTDISGNTGYKVQRKTGAAGAWGQIGTTGAGVATYIDTTVAAGTLYYYRIVAVNGGGDSAFSNEQSTTTTPAKPVISLASPSVGEIDIMWKVVYGATNYKIQRKIQGETYIDLINKAVAYAEDYCGFGTPTVACPVRGPVKATHANTGLAANTTYCYRMVAWNATGSDSAASDEKCLKTASLPSVTLTGTAENAFKVRLDWVPASCAQGTCDPPYGYEIERLLGSGQYGQIGTASGSATSFATSWGIDPVTSYWFRVRPYRLVASDFSGGIDLSMWNQRGLVRNAANGVVTDDTTPPVNIVDATNGSAIIAATDGAVEITTTSPGGGIGDSYNFSRINLLTPGTIRDDFDMTIDYRLPNGQVTKTQYHVYGRLQVNLPNTSGGNDVFYVERNVYNGINSYNAVFTVEGVNKYGYAATSDTSGKLRISRSNGKITCYVWTNGAWSPLADTPYASTAAATFAGFTQYVQRNEAVNLKVVVDNFSATTDKAQWAEVKVTTPAYAPAAAVCQ